MWKGCCVCLLDELPLNCAARGYEGGSVERCLSGGERAEEDRTNTRSIQESIGNVVDCQIGRNVNVLQDMFHFFVKVVGDNSVDDRGLANLC